MGPEDFLVVAAFHVVQGLIFEVIVFNVQADTAVAVHRSVSTHDVYPGMLTTLSVIPSLSQVYVMNARSTGVLSKHGQGNKMHS